VETLRVYFKDYQKGFNKHNQRRAKGVCVVVVANSQPVGFYQKIEQQGRGN
jgi:hypothetical protein